MILKYFVIAFVLLTQIFAAADDCERQATSSLQKIIFSKRTETFSNDITSVFTTVTNPVALQYLLNSISSIFFWDFSLADSILPPIEKHIESCVSLLDTPTLLMQANRLIRKESKYTGHKEETTSFRHLGLHFYKEKQRRELKMDDFEEKLLCLEFYYSDLYYVGFDPFHCPFSTVRVPINELPIQKICEKIQEANNTVRDLYIRRIDCYDAELLAKALASPHCQLTSLRLNTSDLYDSGTTLIVNASRTIREFDFSYTKISDECLAILRSDLTKKVTIESTTRTEEEPATFKEGPLFNDYELELLKDYAIHLTNITTPEDIVVFLGRSPFIYSYYWQLNNTNRTFFNVSFSGKPYRKSIPLPAKKMAAYKTYLSQIGLIQALQQSEGRLVLVDYWDTGEGISSFIRLLHELSLLPTSVQLALSGIRLSEIQKSIEHYTQLPLVFSFDAYSYPTTTNNQLPRKFAIHFTVPGLIHFPLSKWGDCNPLESDYTDNIKETMRAFKTLIA